jgi:N-acetylglucosamine-6-phosphate deacetylase
VQDGTLSGSALTLLKAIKNCVEQLQLPLEEALRMASLYPARAVQIDKKLGKIESKLMQNLRG